MTSQKTRTTTTHTTHHRPVNPVAAQSQSHSSAQMHSQRPSLPPPTSLSLRVPASSPGVQPLASSDRVVSPTTTPRTPRLQTAPTHDQPPKSSPSIASAPGASAPTSSTAISSSTSRQRWVWITAQHRRSRARHCLAPPHQRTESESDDERAERTRVRYARRDATRANASLILNACLNHQVSRTPELHAHCRANTAARASTNERKCINTRVASEGDAVRASDDAVDGENDLFSLRANENKSSDMW